MHTKAKHPPIPNGVLPQTVRWFVSRARKQGYEVWVTRKVLPIEPYPGVKGITTLWLTWSKKPDQRKVWTTQFERIRWSHQKPRHKSSIHKGQPTGWNQDYAHRRWGEFAADGWVRII